MQDIAEIIVNKARKMPVDIGVALESNGATIAKVKVTGGVGLEVKVRGGVFTSEDRALLFPMAELPMAVQSFLTAAHLGAIDNSEKYVPTVRHTNGVPLLRFEWNCDKARAKAACSVSRLLLHPPLCREAEAPAEASIPFDARGRVGWDVDSVSPMVEETQENESSGDDEE